MRCVDLFSGCGGMSLGFTKAGFDVVAALENWDNAISCYNNNFQHSATCFDLHDWKSAIEFIKPLNADIIVGGPPCQDFSHAGQREEGKRAKLTVSFARIVADVKPRFFVMENVDLAKSSDAYSEARNILVAAGYGLTEEVLWACHCGVPQRRKRFFCIGGQNEQNGFMNGVIESRLSEMPLTVAEGLKDRFKQSYYYVHPRTYGRRAIFSIFEPAPTIRGSNRPLPPDYKKHPQDPVDPHEAKIRSLTFRERAAIQTFPEDFQWLDSATINNQLIGNAVPIKLAEFIGKCIYDYAAGTVSVKSIGFLQWLKSEKAYSERAAGNVVSRIRRIRKIISREYEKIEYAESIRKLEESEQFLGCTASVKSQLKRALALYNEYMNQGN